MPGDLPARPADLPAVVQLHPGEVRHFPLPTAAGAGYRWEIERIDGDPRVGDATVATATPPPGPGNGDAPAALVVTARGSGATRWRLRLVRPFGPPLPLSEATIRLEVGG